ncbi:hypothetical protein THICB2_570007 [Thiomonas sp. CB2]|nr:hypothetical protein THICB2_570007 [Thiomonas sp. CB2]
MSARACSASTALRSVSSRNPNAPPEAGRNHPFDKTAERKSLKTAAASFLAAWAHPTQCLQDVPIFLPAP